MVYDSADVMTGRLSPLDDDDILTEPEQREASPSDGRRVWLIAATVMLLLVAVVIGTYRWWQMPASTSSASVRGKGVFVEAPAMVVNVRGADGRPHLLKLRFVLVASDDAAAAEAKASMPMLIDGFQSFVRELRPEDLDGSAAIFRIKEEMMIRAHAVLGADGVDDILIQDLIEQ